MPTILAITTNTTEFTINYTSVQIFWERKLAFKYLTPFHYLDFRGKSSKVLSRFIVPLRSELNHVLREESTSWVTYTQLLSLCLIPLNSSVLILQIHNRPHPVPTTAPQWPLPILTTTAPQLPLPVLTTAPQCSPPCSHYSSSATPPCSHYSSSVTPLCSHHSS